MATEIELKARVRNYEALKIVLAEKAEYLGTFEKDDSYWFTEGEPRAPGPPPGAANQARPYGLRLRKEKRVLPEGAEKAACVVTIKKKKIEGGIEINDEREFEVKPADQFEEFLKTLGFEPRSSKRKKGWAFSLRGITAELVEVEGLGWFVELEILADNKRAGTLAREKKRLLDFLASLGVEREAVESRSYSAMLAELNPRG